VAPKLLLYCWSLKLVVAEVARMRTKLLLVGCLVLFSNLSRAESESSHAIQAPIVPPAASQPKMEWQYNPTNKCYIGRLVAGAPAPTPVAGVGDVARDPAQSVLMKPLTCPSECGAQVAPMKCTAMKMDGEGKTVNRPENRYIKAGNNLCAALLELCHAAREAKLDPARLLVTSCE
jgi:hypothetical protein